MPAPLTVIIPTLNALAVLGPTLAALAEGLEAGLIAELIISDGGSHDDIATVADLAGAVLLTNPPGRGAQLAAGAEQARGTWLLFLHADTVLQPGWTQAVVAHIAQFNDQAAYFQLKFDEKRPAAHLIAGGANLRSRWLGLPYGDQGLLISRDLYQQVGGVPALPLMEDVALARCLRGRLRALEAVAQTSAARYQRDGWVKRPARNLWLLTRYFLGADPEKLARAYTPPPEN